MEYLKKKQKQSYVQNVRLVTKQKSTDSAHSEA